MKPIFITCSKCGKRLIERKKNGIFYFLFGKPANGSDNFIPVEIYIQGNIKIKCIRRTCGYWQTLTYFPNVFQSEDNSEPDCSKQENLTLQNKEV